MARDLTCTTEQDPFCPKYTYSISHNMTHIHGRPRLAITADSHELLLQEYIQFKTDWNHNQFHPVDWGNFELAVKKFPPVYLTNVIEMGHNWVHDEHQKSSLFYPEET